MNGILGTFAVTNRLTDGKMSSLVRLLKMVRNGVDGTKISRF